MTNYDAWGNPVYLGPDIDPYTGQHTGSVAYNTQGKAVYTPPAFPGVTTPTIPFLPGIIDVFGAPIPTLPVVLVVVFAAIVIAIWWHIA